MAQSAVQKNPLNIEPFWQKTSANPPTPWERWATLVEIAVYARDGITLLDLNADKPTEEEIQLPPEPTYEQPYENEVAAETRNREIRNTERKEVWLAKCERLQEVGAYVKTATGQLEWDVAVRRCVSSIWLSLGAEGQRLLTQRFPTWVCQKSTVHIQNLLEEL